MQRAASGRQYDNGFAILIWGRQTRKSISLREKSLILSDR
jgi:hypothetical protein